MKISFTIEKLFDYFIYWVVWSLLSSLSEIV